jgi:RecA-family ATPase
MDLDSYLRDGVSQGDRNNNLYRAALAAREQGWDEARIRERIGEKARAVDGLPQYEVDRTIQSAMQRDDVVPQAPQGNITQFPSKLRLKASQIPLPAHDWQTDDLDRLLRAAFRDDEYVCYAPSSSAGHPQRGRFHSSEELQGDLDGRLTSEALALHPSAGAFVKVNPMDGNGENDANVAAYRHTLLESDDLPIDEQWGLVTNSRVPVTAAIHSGNKSIHFWVRVDAVTREQYDERVMFLHDHMASLGFQPDQKCKNPSRHSRLPGVYRGDAQQYLLGTDLGYQDWHQWMEALRSRKSGLPAIECATAWVDEHIEPARELISGLLREGHKLMLSGPSKIGKSFLLIHLAMCVASGARWYNWACAKGRVLYVNFEVASESFKNRVQDVRLHVPDFDAANWFQWDLRGHMPASLTTFVDELVEGAQSIGPRLIVLDPIYKLLSHHDENTANHISAACNELDRIGTATGAALAYVHHFSKQGHKDSQVENRASGSGVFARDPDAIGTLTPEGDEWGVTRLEWSLREFPRPRSVKLRMRHPVPEVLDGGYLEPTQANMPKKDAVERYLETGEGNVSGLADRFNLPAYAVGNHLRGLGYVVINNKIQHPVTTFDVDMEPLDEDEEVPF